MCWCSGTVYSPKRLVSCLSRSLNLVCKILKLLSSMSETNTIGSYWIPGSYAPSIVREAQLLFKAIEKEGLQGGKGDNNWVVRHRQIPRPWNPTRASRKSITWSALPDDPTSWKNARALHPRRDSRGHDV